MYLEDFTVCDLVNKSKNNNFKKIKFDDYFSQMNKTLYDITILKINSAGILIRDSWFSDSELTFIVFKKKHRRLLEMIYNIILNVKRSGAYFCRCANKISFEFGKYIGKYGYHGIITRNYSCLLDPKFPYIIQLSFINYIETDDIEVLDDGRFTFSYPGKYNTRYRITYSIEHINRILRYYYKYNKNYSDLLKMKFLTMGIK